MSWKRSVIANSVILTTLLIMAGVLQSRVSASLRQANLRVIHGAELSGDRPAVSNAPVWTLLTQATRPTFSIRSFEIGGVSMGANPTQIEQELGTPQQTENRYWNCCGNVRTLRYPATQIRLIEGETPGSFTVFSFSTTRPDLATSAGVRVGDSQQKLAGIYGQSTGSRSEAGVTTVFYGLDEYAANLWFRVRNGRIIEIGFEAQLT